jgi:hypothetical protein
VAKHFHHLREEAHHLQQLVPWEETMKPTIEVVGKKVLLLSGYSTLLKAGSRKTVAQEAIKIEALDDLRRSAKKNPDAVAFGFTAGRWVPAA